MMARTDFKKAARRLLLTTALAAGLALPFRYAQQPQGGREPAGDAPKIETVTTATDGTREEKHLARDNRKTNREMLIAIRNDFDKIQSEIKTGYCRHLEQQADSLTRYFRADTNARHDRAVFIRPFMVDVAMALDFMPSYAVERAIHGLPHAGSIDAGTLGTFAAVSRQSPVGDLYLTQEAQATPNLFNDSHLRLLVIVPSSDYAPAEYGYPLAGLTTAQNVLFTNLHEMWHGANDKFTLDGLAEPFIFGMNFGVLADGDAHPDRATAISRICHAEIFSDVAACGDMVRMGYPLSVIEAVSFWRQANNKDFLHRSDAALAALAQHIDSIGIETFRALPATEARQIYEAVTAGNGPSPEVIAINARYAAGDRDDKRAIDSLATQTADSLHVLAKKMRDEMKKPGKIAPRPPADTAMQARVDNWAVLDSLKTRAIAYSGGTSITPFNVIRAYAAMQDSLAAMMRQNPYDKVLPVLRMRLQATFIENLSTIDYAGINRQLAKTAAATRKPDPAR